MTSLLPGFTRRDIVIDGARIAVHVGGDGPPLLMLHGYPQTHATWLGTAPGLAARFTCVVPDLPGYGDSEALPDGPPDAPLMSKRALAARMVALMATLGHGRFHVLGHDRGARVSYRLALDHPDAVDRLGIIEVVPTAEMWRAFTADMALKTYHWTFLAQPYPLPERMIDASPEAYIDWTLQSWTRAGDLSAFPPAALATYRAQARSPASIHAMCQDYRAGATVDRALDEADRAAGRTILAPLHFLWSDSGFPARTGDPLALWRRWAPHVTGAPVAAGHFAQEENPGAVLKAYLPFFSAP
ncbi:MAG: haloacetate dehalogenase [Paracoccaceae bacterium]|jgi:haloacetate dehalogenase